MMSNVGWGRVLHLVKRERYPLTLALLRQTSTVDQADVDMEFLATQVWSVLGQHAFGDYIYGRRTQLANGEAYSGIDLWRRLHVESNGGAEQVVMAGLRRLHHPPNVQTGLSWRLAR